MEKRSVRTFDQYITTIPPPSYLSVHVLSLDALNHAVDFQMFFCG